MARQKKVKDPFEALDSNYKDAVSQMSPADIIARVAEVALAECLNRQTKDADPDLAQARDAYKLLAEPYSEETKMNRLKIKFAKQVLEDKGAKF